MLKIESKCYKTSAKSTDPLQDSFELHGKSLKNTDLFKLTHS